MGDFSQQPADILSANWTKGYRGLHFEQGVPILDRDLNLLQDIILETVRSVLKGYMGSGIPFGENGFEICALGDANDFQIHAGDLPPARCLVGGVEVTIDKDYKYSEKNGDILHTPTTEQRTDTVYLDVYFEEVDSSNDKGLNNSDVGMQTSVRLRPAWTMRVAESGVTPADTIDHKYLPLATLNRVKGNAQITQDMIKDERVRLFSFEKLYRALLIPTFRELSDDPYSEFSPSSGSADDDITLFGKNLILSPEFNGGDLKVFFGDNSHPAQISPPDTNHPVPYTDTHVIVKVPEGLKVNSPVKIILQNKYGTSISKGTLYVKEK